MRGFQNYFTYLLGRTKREVDAVVEGELYQVYGGHFPALLPGKGTVKGQLMFIRDEVYDTVLKGIDALEWYDPLFEETSMYLRREVIATTVFGEEVECYTYVFNLDKSYLEKKIDGGDWRQYKKQF